MDELDIEFNEAELDLIKNGLVKLDFPAIYVGESVICFNREATRYVPDYIYWYSSSEYIIGIPANKKNKYSFKVRSDSRSAAKRACFPVRMKKEKRVKSGYYKLYKYKNGIAFKRYEPLEIRE